MVRINNIVITVLMVINTSLAFTVTAYAESAQPKMPPIVVDIIKVQAGAGMDKITATGNLIAIPGIVVKAEIAGRITNIYFNAGGKVKAGTPLIEIYPGIIKAELAQAQAELKLAKLDFERKAQLHETHVISDADYDKAKSLLESSKGKVEQYQATLEQTFVHAPFDGRLGVSQVSLGQHVAVGDDIVSLQSLAPIYVDFTVPEADASKIAVGQIVNIRSDVYPKEIFSGTVCVIDPLINKNTRSLTVRAVIANKEEKLLPGAFADVTVFTSAQKQVIKIPQTAIVRDPKETYVYKVQDGRAIKTVIATGEQDANDIVVASGLVVGDVVIVKGQMKVHKSGEPVVVASK